MEDHLVLIFCLHFFPGRYDQNVVYIELMEVLFPVIDPVFVLCLGFCDGTFADIHVSAYFFKDSTYFLENRRSFCVLFQIKIQIGDSIIRWTFRHNIHKHLLFICLGKRLFVPESLRPQLPTSARAEMITSSASVFVLMVKRFHFILFLQSYY